MLISYLIVSSLLGLWISYVWSSNGAANCLVKVIFSAFTLWSTFMLLAAAWPLLNTGSIHLI